MTEASAETYSGTSGAFVPAYGPLLTSIWTSSLDERNVDSYKLLPLGMTMPTPYTLRRSTRITSPSDWLGESERTARTPDVSTSVLLIQRRSALIARLKVENFAKTSHSAFFGSDSPLLGTETIPQSKKPCPHPLWMDGSPLCSESMIDSCKTPLVPSSGDRQK